MKKMLLLLLIPALWAGCTVSDVPRSISFTDSGCSKTLASRAGYFNEAPSLLILKYEDGNLRVTRTNAIMNCSIKEGGIGCDVTFDGDVINYDVYEKDGPATNCMCPVEKMSSLITGLTLGKEYKFNYYYSHRPSLDYTPVTFIFEEGFVHIQGE